MPYCQAFMPASWLATPFLLPRGKCTGLAWLASFHSRHFICLMSRQPKMHYFPSQQQCFLRRKLEILWMKSLTLHLELCSREKALTNISQFLIIELPELTCIRSLQRTNKFFFRSLQAERINFFLEKPQTL